MSAVSLLERMADWQWLMEAIAEMPEVTRVIRSRVWKAEPPRKIPEVVILPSPASIKLMCFSGLEFEAVIVLLKSEELQRSFQLELIELMNTGAIVHRWIEHRPDLETESALEPKKFVSRNGSRPISIKLYPGGKSTMSTSGVQDRRLQASSYGWLPTARSFVDWLLNKRRDILRLEPGAIKTHVGVYQVPETTINTRQKCLEVWFYEGERYQEFRIFVQDLRSLEQEIMTAISEKTCPLPPEVDFQTSSRVPDLPWPVAPSEVAMPVSPPVVPVLTPTTGAKVVELTESTADMVDYLRAESRSGSDSSYEVTAVASLRDYYLKKGGVVSKINAYQLASSKVAFLQSKGVLDKGRDNPTQGRPRLFRLLPVTIVRKPDRKGGNRPIKPEATSRPAVVRLPVAQAESTVTPRAIPVAAVTVPTEDLSSPADTIGELVDLLEDTAARIRVLGWQVDPIQVRKTIS